ncbi:MAG TPA: hypothetical protein VLD35_05695 [Caldimonas sp.]|nr:hypothetical protein [Caldimonas sp.]
MAWNLRLLKRPPPSVAADASSARPESLSPAARAQLLGVFRRLAAVLQMTAQIAHDAGKGERHAALGARLAIFQARVEAGDTGARLALALADFGRELEAFITTDLGCRRVWPDQAPRKP